MAVSRAYRLHPITGSPHQFVLGMTWQTVLGQNLETAAARAAREAGATHYTQAGPRSPAVGVIRATGRDNRSKAKSRLYSAAAAFAQLYRHGAHIGCIDLADGGTWIVVAVDGVVQAGGDLVAPSAQQGRQKLDELRQRYGDVVIHAQGVASAQPFTLHQLTSLANAQSALKRASFRASMVAPIWWWLAALCVMALAAKAVLEWKGAREHRERERIRALESAVDPEVIWKQAIAAWAENVKTDGSAGLQRLLDAVGSAPTNPGRWLLQELDCRPNACVAVYKRGRLANNQTLQDVLPAGWTVQFADLDTARVQWRLAASTLPSLDLDALPGASMMAYGYLPAWQGLRPAAQDLTLSAAVPVAIAAPMVKLPNGLDHPIAIPATIEIPAVRSLVINAPLRALGAVALPATTVIEQLQVRHLPDAAPTLANSQLVATLRGMIYVRP